MFKDTLPEVGNRVIITNKRSKSYGMVGEITRIRVRSTSVLYAIDRFLYITLLNGKAVIFKDAPNVVEIINKG